MVEMSKERAIEILKGVMVQNCSGCFHPQVVGFCEEQCSLPSAIDMACKALGGKTNKEWLLTLEAEEVYKMMTWLFNTYGQTEKNLKEGIIRWLNDPRTETDN